MGEDSVGDIQADLFDASCDTLVNLSVDREGVLPPNLWSLLLGCHLYIQGHNLLSHL